MASPKALRFRMSLGVTTFITTVMFLAGVVILARGSFLPELTLTPSSDPAIDIALLIGVPAILAVILAVGSAADRKCADDFAYQLLATSAMIGMFTIIGTNAIWAIDFLRDAIGIRDLRGPDMMAIGLVGWGVSYLAFRIRGGLM
mgnify:CR=1 FL=1